MDKLRILLVGGPSGLREELEQHYDVVDGSNSAQVADKLRQERIHLSIIYLQWTGEQVDPDLSALALMTEDHPPTILVLSKPMDQMSQIVRDALGGLEHPAPAVALISEQEEGLGAILRAVEECVKRHIRINQELVIQSDGDALRDIANHLMPEDDPKLWTPELEDLFRILFSDCSSISIKLLTHGLQSPKGGIANVWVQPQSQAVPEGHPLLVKCGRRKDVENIRARYEAYFFRLTHVRLAGCAHTRSFGALAYPAPAYPTPGDRLDVYDFSEFYRIKVGTGADGDIGSAIDYLFDRAGKPWYRQVGAPSTLRDKDLRSCYLKRLGIPDKQRLEGLMREVVEKASSYGARVELGGKEVGIAIPQRAQPHQYPNLVLHLYGDDSRLKVFDAKPSQFGISHGNLCGSNLCVDRKGIVWLDGCENLEWGPYVADVAGIEALLKFRCLEWNNPRDLYRLERLILLRDDLEPKTQDTLPLEISQTLKWIAHVRQRANALSSDDILEYYASLFFFTMREFVAKETKPVQKLHALFSAAMICYLLVHWDKWDGWPGPETVLPAKGAES